MKYDIAKNEEGPLRRTVKSENAQGKQKQVEDSKGKDGVFDERLTNLETHLAVRYGQSQVPICTILFRCLTPNVSPITANNHYRKAQIPRGLYHPTRERISSLGGITF
jgi:hypothetical protein